MASDISGKKVGDWGMFKIIDLIVLLGEFKIACHMIHDADFISDVEYEEKIEFIKQFEDVLYEDKKKKEKS